MAGLNDSHYVTCHMNPHPFHDECRIQMAHGWILMRQFIACRPDPDGVQRLAEEMKRGMTPDRRVRK